MKYYVSVTEMLNTVVRVEAESEKEAIDKAKYEYSDGVIELTREDNYSGEQFEIDDDQEYWREAEENGNTVLQHPLTTRMLCLTGGKRTCSMTEATHSQVIRI